MDILLSSDPGLWRVNLTFTAKGSNNTGSENIRFLTARLLI